jgi:putative sigma-54 modulation protein
MTLKPTPVELEVTLRHIEPEESVREYTIDRLGKVISSLPNLRSALVEISYEDTKAAEHRYVVEVTLEADGSLLRAEDRGPGPMPTIDRVHDLLERRIRDWKGHVYFERRQAGAEYKEAVVTERASLPPEDKTGLIVRLKSHELKPMFPEDAVEQMELLGHDFYFFLNAETNQHNVVYRRKAGGYGLIEPASGEAPGTGQ